MKRYVYRFEDCRYEWLPIQACILAYRPRKHREFETLAAPFPPQNADMQRWAPLHEGRVVKLIHAHHREMLKRQESITEAKPVVESGQSGS